MDRTDRTDRTDRMDRTDRKDGQDRQDRQDGQDRRDGQDRQDDGQDGQDRQDLPLVSGIEIFFFGFSLARALSPDQPSLKSLPFAATRPGGCILTPRLMFVCIPNTVRVKFNPALQITASAVNGDF